MQITNVKAMVAKMFTVGLLAGAVVMAAPAKAEAQVSFGIRVGPAVAYGRPVYPAPVYGYGYDAPAYGYDSPAYGYDASSYGYQAPAYGYAAPGYGYYGRQGYAHPDGWGRHEDFDRRDEFRRDDFRRDDRHEDFRRDDRHEDFHRDDRGGFRR